MSPLVPSLCPIVCPTNHFPYLIFHNIFLKGLHVSCSPTPTHIHIMINTTFWAFCLKLQKFKYSQYKMQVPQGHHELGLAFHFIITSLNFLSCHWLKSYWLSKRFLNVPCPLICLSLHGPFSLSKKPLSFILPCSHLCLTLTDNKI